MLHMVLCIQYFDISEVVVREWYIWYFHAYIPHSYAMLDLRSTYNTNRGEPFLGLESYYRKLIDNFSKIAKPLTTLIQKDTKFKGEEKQESMFQTLKHMLCSASIMALTEGIEDFVFYYDASHQGMGCVLM